jgi:hypothetical protein
MAAGVAGGVAAGVGTAAAIHGTPMAGTAFGVAAPWLVGAAMIYSALF